MFPRRWQHVFAQQFIPQTLAEYCVFNIQVDMQTNIKTGYDFIKIVSLLSPQETLNIIVAPAVTTGHVRAISADGLSINISEWMRDERHLKMIASYHLLYGRLVGHWKTWYFAGRIEVGNFVNGRPYGWWEEWNTLRIRTRTYEKYYVKEDSHRW